MISDQYNLFNIWASKSFPFLNWSEFGQNFIGYFISEVGRQNAQSVGITSGVLNGGASGAKMVMAHCAPPCPFFAKEETTVKFSLQLILISIAAELFSFLVSPTTHRISNSVAIAISNLLI